MNNLVDINNLVSLETALPISMFDADKLGTPAVVRFGRSGERYVFNVSGQSMDVTGIPVVCRAAIDEPVGNAVKDSMLAKVGPETRLDTPKACRTQYEPDGHDASRAIAAICLKQIPTVNCVLARRCQAPFCARTSPTFWSKPESTTDEPTRGSPM